TVAHPPHSRRVGCGDRATVFAIKSPSRRCFGELTGFRGAARSLPFFLVVTRKMSNYLCPEAERI
ncbi:MAG TPA: hypothetical protein VK363_08510, partial [Pyrinomonadaceae bacterium]|nr:hypothetical protein [Pyrinomonadaceae bacterium]